MSQVSESKGDGKKVAVPFFDMIFILGPTAVGKSSVGIELARRVNGEIVSCDAFQVYDDIRIASNIPPSEDLDGVPHHLLNYVSLEEEFDVSQYVQKATSVIEDILKREKTPVIVGGSGLYAQALLDGLPDGVEGDEELRASITCQIEAEGEEVVYQRLKELDPQAAEKIHPHNHPRLIRALEVCLKTGKRFSEIKSDRSGLWDKYRIKVFVLDQDRDILYQRINQRVDEMFEAGIVDEVKAVAKRNLSRTVKAMIGLKEVLTFLTGEVDLNEARDRVKKNTRHFAKRQWTWFRKEKRAVWIDVKEKNLCCLVDEILNELNETN